MRRIITEGKNKYLIQEIWIVMGGCIHNEDTGCILHVNFGFNLFIMGVNMSVLLCFDWYRKA